ncbi:MAG: hypothetical protein BMS9Abin20_1349 [Acidimicrobiia bacterium]|nr:MAG: hypothetical protein BMS9Abin20_1349 [Acidimicrobiia bacterium]
MTTRKDPNGKRALFEVPPIEIDDTLRGDPLVDRHDTDGHDALYSAGHREPGTTVITCSSCEVRSRTTVIETVVRILSISLWDPRRDHSRWMQCPSCQTRTWCKVEWLS